MSDKFENILARREAEFRGFGAASVHGLFTGHAKKSDSEVRFCYDFVSRVFPKLEDSEQQRLRIKLDDLLLKSCCVPVKSSYQAKLHDAEDCLGRRSSTPKTAEKFASAVWQQYGCRGKDHAFFAPCS